MQVEASWWLQGTRAHVEALAAERPHADVYRHSSEATVLQSAGVSDAHTAVHARADTARSGIGSVGPVLRAMLWQKTGRHTTRAPQASRAC